MGLASSARASGVAYAETEGEVVHGWAKQGRLSDAEPLGGRHRWSFDHS